MRFLLWLMLGFFLPAIGFATVMLPVPIKSIVNVVVQGIAENQVIDKDKATSVTIVFPAQSGEFMVLGFIDHTSIPCQAQQCTIPAGFSAGPHAFGVEVLDGGTVVGGTVVNLIFK